MPCDIVDVWLADYLAGFAQGHFRLPLQDIYRELPMGRLRKALFQVAAAYEQSGYR